jgi:hypothetical protein
VVTEGTIAYLITLDNGFRIMYRDSGGRVTDFEKSAMERTGRVDVALVAVSASYLNTVTVPQALEHIRTYKPTSFPRITMRPTTTSGARPSRCFRR